MKPKGPRAEPSTPLIIKHDVKQNTPEWYQLRGQYRCASETASLVSAGFLNTNIPLQALVERARNNKSVQKIIAKLKSNAVGKPVHEFYAHTTIPAMLHGSICENSAADIIVKHFTPNDLKVLGAESEVITYQNYLASIDVAILTTSKDLPKVYVEIKCPYNTETSPYWRESYKSLPLYVKSQMQHQLFVTGVSHMMYFAFDFDRDQPDYKQLINNPNYLMKSARGFKCFPVHRNNKFIRAICKMWDRLYNHCLINAKEVPKTASPIFELEAQLDDCLRNLKKYETLKKSLRDQMIPYVDDDTRAFFGDKFRITKSETVQRRINVRLLEKLIDKSIYQQCVTPYTQTKYTFINLLRFKTKKNKSV